MVVEGKPPPCCSDQSLKIQPLVLKKNYLWRLLIECLITLIYKIGIDLLWEDNLCAIDNPNKKTKKQYSIL